MDKPLLKVCGLKKSFGGVEVLHSIDFIAEAGKVTALVGENGAGKSTLMKILCGMTRADAGSIFDGKIWSRKCIERIGALIELLLFMKI